MSWPNHWNGVWGLGTKPPTEAITVTDLLVAPADLDAAPAQLGDAEDVLVLLGGQADEEVELHPPPTLAEGGVDRRVEVLFA